MSQAVPSRDEIVAWLRKTVSQIIETEPERVDVHAPLARFGIDSASALIITDMLGEWLGLELDATLLYEHETIDALAKYLSVLVASEQGSGGGGGHGGQ